MSVEHICRKCASLEGQRPGDICRSTSHRIAQRGIAPTIFVDRRPVVSQRGNAPTIFVENTTSVREIIAPTIYSGALPLRDISIRDPTNIAGRCPYFTSLPSNARFNILCRSASDCCKACAMVSSSLSQTDKRDSISWTMRCCSGRGGRGSG